MPVGAADRVDRDPWAWASAAALDFPLVTSAPAPSPSGSSGLPAAVLWDMDGTLIDSEPYWILEEHALVESYGGRWTDAHAHALVGNPLEVSAQYILDHSPVRASVAEVVDRLMHGVMDRIRVEVPWRPGALDLLTGLSALGVPNALVTMSWKPFADLVVELVPPGSFAVVVTGDAVDHGKPHPEPYLTAARLLGVEASDCVAIEDSPAGVGSAVAAGVPTIAVPHVVPVPRHPGAVQLPSLHGVGPYDLLTAVAGVSPGRRG
jgi:HAD superfamily hydrolase (TIGR01509 family)